MTRLLLALGLLWPLGASAAECPDVKMAPIALPRMQQVVAANREVVIVALGSSSTEGSQSSDMGHTYPAVLQAELQAGLPAAHIAVVNRGIGGQDAPEELARLDTDVLAIRPALVIWQVGANGAMRGNDPGEFKQLVTAGVRKLSASGADVILMDNQRSPKVLASPQAAKIDQALADVAGTMGVRLFTRGRLMELWREAGAPYADFIAGDGIHHNDRGYACVAKTLASAILAGLGPQAPQQLQARR